MADFKRIRPCRGRVTVEFGLPKVSTESVGGIAVTPLKGSSLVAPANRRENIDDDYREEGEKNNEGVVVKLGAAPVDSAGRTIPWEFAEGDRVLVKKAWGTLAAKTDEKELRLFSQSEIAGIIEPEEVA